MRSLVLTTAVMLAAGTPPILAQEPDKRVALRVAAQLKANDRLAGCEFSVQCAEGKAVLRGRVNESRQASEAVATAAETVGVNEVINYLVVRSGVSTTDLWPPEVRPPAAELS